MDSPRAKKKVMRAPAVSASFGSTNLMTGGEYLVEDDACNFVKSNFSIKFSESLQELVS